MPFRYLLDTSILADLIRHPRGPVANQIANAREFSRVPQLRTENWLTEPAQ